jgi:hypothetical protein
MKRTFKELSYLLFLHRIQIGEIIIVLFIEFTHFNVILLVVVLPHLYAFACIEQINILTFVYTVESA